ncbi:hypothetical protein [Microvirga subterranea]|uniref:Uncharacterized protein n=1 Tax=Microvirga subterranea TaxID=186651 RepID=A0A370H563_9HYPH|nr:hypothetical protein [Microvirga subterranea]RDI51221.1 hypothetical protein DES45_1194 [Microvirga subterranea]
MNPINSVTITGLTRVPQPKPGRNGYTILAYFSAEANGFSLQGCAFVRTPRQGLTVWPPKLEGLDTRRSLTITNDQLRQAMVRQAQAAYRALGGSDGEWIRDDDEDMPAPSRTDVVIEEDAGLQRYLLNCRP